MIRYLLIKNFISNIKTVFLIGSLIYSSSLYCDQELQNHYRNLIIINGQKNENISKTSNFFTTNKLVSALEQKCAPILVSVNVWRNYVERRQEFAMRAALENTREQKLVAHHNEVLKKLNVLTTFFKKHVTSFAEIKQLITQQCHDDFQKKLELLKKDNLVQKEPTDEPFFTFLTYLQEFDPNSWDFYRVNDYYYLLIPHTYSEKISSSALQKSWDKFTEQKLLLGLKVDQLERISEPLNASIFCFEPVKRQEDEIVEVLNKLFITYNDTSAPELYLWNIFLAAHGATVLPPLYSTQTSENDCYDMIAEFSVNEFKNILLFLNEKIKTSLFMYSTCFGAGKHLKNPYMQEGKPLLLNYTVVINNLTDVLSYGHGKIAIPPLLHKEKFILDYYSYDSKKGIWSLKLDINSHNNWKKIFKIVDRFNKENDSEILLTDQFLGCFGRHNLFIDNIPNIRFAGSDAFVIYPSLTSVKINPMMVALKKLSHNPIIVNGQNNILVETENVDVPLQIQTKDPLARIISVISGKNNHYLERLEAKNYTFLDILKSFWPLRSNLFDKTFFIKELLCTCDPKSPEAKLIGQETQEVEFTNVLIGIEEDYLVRIFFQTKKGKAFSCYGRRMQDQKEPSFGLIVPLDEKTVRDYLNHCENVKKEIVEHCKNNQNHSLFEEELQQFFAENEKH